MQASKYATEPSTPEVKTHKRRASSMQTPTSASNGLFDSKYASPPPTGSEAQDKTLSLEDELAAGGSLLDSKYADLDSPVVANSRKQPMTPPQEQPSEAAEAATPTNPISDGTPAKRLPSPAKSALSNTDKELPPVPEPFAQPVSPIAKDPAQTSPEASQTTAPQITPATADLQATKAPTPDVQRLDTPALAARGIRKVYVKGKAAIVRFQPDAARIYSEIHPLSKSEVDARLAAFEEEGYDVRGFSYWKGSDGTQLEDVQGQNRREFPDPQDQKHEREQRNFVVQVPDRRKWESYMSDLTEQRLRMLGVTNGDDVPASEPAIPSRSPGPRLPISPPGRSSSSASQHAWGNAVPFSAPYSPAMSTNNTSMGGVVSPVSSLGRPSHIRQSTVGFPFPHAPGPAAPQQPWPVQSPRLMDEVATVRRNSPASMQRMPSNLSQGSSDVFNDRLQTPRGQFEELQSVSRDNVKPSTPQEQTIPEAEEMDAYGELAYPTPRGHRHNISENLERGLRDSSAQYYPGEYVDEKEPEAAAQQSVESDTAKTATNVGGPLHEKSVNHQSTGSTSRLNVEAKEFKFKPDVSHGRSFSTSKNPFMPAAAKPMVAKPLDPLNPTVSLATAEANKGFDHSSNFNVSAPPFQPPAHGTFSFSRPGFDFSNPARIQEAQRNTPETDASSSDQKQSSTGSRIFGQLNLSDVIKPGRGSKAIPIVKPGRESKAIPIIDPNELAKADSSREDDDHFDEEGRLSQGDARRKRGRLAAGDGDEVPQFASPTPEPEIPKAQDPAEQERETSDLHRESPAEEEKSRDLPEVPAGRTVDAETDFTAPPTKDRDIPWHELSDDDQTKDTTLDAKFEEGPENNAPEEEHPQHQRPPYPEGATTSKDSLLFPTFQEIDAVMEQLNSDNVENSDFGIENEPPATAKYVPPQLRLHQNATTDEQSPGAVEVLDSVEPEVKNQETESPESPPVNNVPEEWVEDQEPRAEKSPVRRLNKLGETPVSDWDDMLSSGAELKIPPRSPFAEPHVSSVIEGLLRRHLEPFERSLKEVQASVKRLSGREMSLQRPVSSYTKTSNSDADDEDDSDNQSQTRAWQNKSDKKLDQIRSVVLEAMASSETRGTGQVEQEVKLRRAAEARADDLQRMLSLSEREIASYKELSENHEDRLKATEEERNQARRRHAAVEEELRTKTLNFTAEASALENTLDEYRTSSSKWKDEIESAKRSREQLQSKIDTLKNEATEHLRVRDSLNERLENMQAELTAARNNILTERSTWHSKDQEQAKKCEVLVARLEEEHRIKSKLGEEIERLSNIEKNAIKTSATLEETQEARARVEARLQKLDEEAREHRNVVARYDRELAEAKENTAAEVQREKANLEAQIEVERKKVEHVRADLETRLHIAKLELESVRNEADSAKERHTAANEEASKSRQDAVREAAEASNVKIQEERAKFDRSLKELSAQHEEAMRHALEDKQRYDTHNNEMQKLASAKIDNLNEKVRLLEDKLSVAQSAAQAAARSAQQARSPPPAAAPVRREHFEKASPQALRESIAVLQEQLEDREAHIDRLQTQLSQIEDAPKKLNERETEIGWLRELLGVRVDDLAELVDTLSRPDFDRAATRDAAIRIRANLQMELQEKERIIASGGTVGASSVGINLSNLRASAEAAATNIQVPSLADIQNFASPRAAQLAAAWGNWRNRRGRGDTSASPTLANLRDAVNAGTPSKYEREPASSPVLGGQQSNTSITGAVANKGQEYQFGLMTPPTSNLRKTPTPPTQIPPAAIQQHRRQGHQSMASSAVPAAQDPLQAAPLLPETPLNRPSSAAKNIVPPASPTTPPLMRKTSYDQDAAAVAGYDEQTSSPETRGSEPASSPRTTRVRRSSAIRREDRLEQVAKTTKLQPLGAWGVGAEEG